jgi:hypothetical protein
MKKASAVAVRGAPPGYALLLSVSCLSVLGWAARTPALLGHLSNLGTKEIAVARKLTASLTPELFGRLLLEAGRRCEHEPQLFAGVRSAAGLIDQAQASATSPAAASPKPSKPKDDTWDTIRLILLCFLVAVAVTAACP